MRKRFAAWGMALGKALGFDTTRLVFVEQDG